MIWVYWICCVLVFFSVGIRAEDSFDLFMAKAAYYPLSVQKYPRFWNHAKKIFFAYSEKRNAFFAYGIPKKIHIIWLGSSPPLFVQKMIRSWQKFHPDFTVQVWTDELVATFPLRNKEAFIAAKNLGEKADILRYEILEKEGGIYVDADFECLQSFKELCLTCDFFTGIAYPYGKQKPFFYSGIIGSVPHHPIIVDAVDHIRRGNGDSDAFRIFHMTGPFYFTKAVCHHWKDPVVMSGMLVMPVEYLYPLPFEAKDTYKKTSMYKKKFTSNVSLAIHYWKLLWLPMVYSSRWQLLSDMAIDLKSRSRADLNVFPFQSRKYTTYNGKRISHNIFDDNFRLDRRAKPLE